MEWSAEDDGWSEIERAKDVKTDEKALLPKDSRDSYNAVRDSVYDCARSPLA